MALSGEPGPADLSSETRENDRGTTEVNIATVLQGLQTTLAQLAKNSELQTEAIQNWKEDILLCSDDEDSEDTPAIDDNTSDNTLDIAATLNNVLDSSDNSKTTSVKSPESGPTQSVLVDSLTQAFTTSKVTSPAIEGKIAELIDNMLIGGLSAETVKERVEKHPPPENCKFLAVTMVNEEIWDLLPRKSRAVDLAFQRVQEPLLQGISALTKLAGKLVKNSQPQMPRMPLKRTKFPVKFYIPPGYHALKTEKPAIFKTATGSIPWKYSTLDAASISKVEGIAMVTQVEILTKVVEEPRFLVTTTCRVLARISNIEVKQPTMSQNGGDHKVADVVISLDESPLLDRDVYSSDIKAVKKQTQKGTQTAEKLSRKGKTGSKQAEAKALEQSQPPASKAGNPSKQKTTIHSSNKLADDVDDIKQQLRDLTGSLACITP
ncbi:hypothetical protein AWC38_SpisGene20092 [Stylophora pistillata]|uniref:Uncharacterized protein n=1 Tax=Stylophora pistillata TaxID=50429 RepID=A0A2B4RHE7_STYPI|nr:hypothetical protein AWC38_SpisGene20092 [Stylophora pistillata]